LSILVLQKAISDFLVCRILKKNHQNVEKIEENIFSMKQKWKSLLPCAEAIASASHSSGSSIIDTEDPQLLLCIHAQLEQSALVMPSSRCDRRKSAPKVGIQRFRPFCGLGKKRSKTTESSKEGLNFLNRSSRLCSD
jgi:hypothetical protein